MKNSYPSLVLSLCVILCLSLLSSSCSKFGTQKFQVPQLKERASDLFPEEFKAQQRKYADAVEGIKAEPNNPKYYSALAKVLVYEARVTGDHPYYYPAALSVLQEALNKKSDDFEASILKANVLLSLHHFAEAKVLSEKLVAQYPSTASLYGMLCDAHVELGEYDDAVIAVDHMMSLRPGLDAYARAAYLREIHGDMPGSYEAMTMAVKAGLSGTEDAAWTRTTLANMYYRYGQYDNAAMQYMLAKSERKNFPNAIAGLAMIEHKRGNDQLALAMLDSALSLQPEVAFVEKKAEIMNDRNMSTQRDSLMHIVETMLNEDEAAGHINHAERAISYCRLGYKLDDALRHAKLEISQRPQNITAQYAMAVALFANNNPTEAKVYIDRAMRTKTTDPDILACAHLIESSNMTSLH